MWAQGILSVVSFLLFFLFQEKGKKERKGDMAVQEEETKDTNRLSPLPSFFLSLSRSGFASIIILIIAARTLLEREELSWKMRFLFLIFRQFPRGINVRWTTQPLMTAGPLLFEGNR